MLRRVRELALVGFDEALQLAFQPSECLLLEDLRARPGDPELPLDRVQRPLLSIEAEAELEHLPFELRQPAERRPDSLPSQRGSGFLGRIRSLGVGEEVAKLGVALTPAV